MVLGKIDFNKIIRMFNDDSGPRTKGEDEMRKTLNSVFETPKKIIGNKNTASKYKNLTDFLSKYAGEDKKLQVNEIRQMLADFKASNLSKIEIGDEEYNIIDGNESGLNVIDTAGNDIIFEHNTNEIKNYKSSGGNDMLLSTADDSPNTVTDLGEVTKYSNESIEEFAKFQKIVQEMLGKSVDKLTEKEFKAAVKAYKTSQEK